MNENNASEFFCQQVWSITMITLAIGKCQREFHGLMKETLLKTRYFERGLSKSIKKLNLSYSLVCKTI